MSLLRSWFVASLVAANAVALGCSSSSNSAADPDAGTASLCASKCARSNAAHCGDEATCQPDCVAEVAQIPPSCKTQLDILVACATNATYTCVGGQAQACTEQVAAVNACIASAPPPSPDAGNPNTGSNQGADAGGVLVDPATICTSGSGDDPCFACDQASCCTELQACARAPRCAQAYACVSTCVVDDQNCFTNCVASLPPELLAVAQCENANCAAQCQ